MRNKVGQEGKEEHGERPEHELDEQHGLGRQDCSRGECLCGADESSPPVYARPQRAGSFFLSQTGLLLDASLAWRS